MTRDADIMIREIESIAARLRKLTDGDSYGEETKGLAEDLLSGMPRRIRRSSVGRAEAWRHWKAQLLTFDPRRMPFRYAIRFRLWRWRLLKLPKMIETMAYWSGVMAFFRHLNRKAKRVLTFHNVLPDALCASDLASGVTMPASVFERTLLRLRKTYGFSTDFSDASALTVTFDDGYRCQFDTAGEILERLGIPAVVFAAGSVMACGDPRQALVVDRLLFWASYAPLESLVAFSGAEVRSRMAFWYETMEPAFRRDSTERGEGVFCRADSIWPFERVLSELNPEMVRLRLTGPDPERVSRLKRCGWKIGWHTRTHFPLAFLSDAEAKCELTPPDRECLSAPMSYPYGTPEAVSIRDERIAREMGYPGGVSNLSEANDREGEFFQLRYTLTGDRVGDESLLSGFRYFMETGHLLKRFAVKGETENGH